MSAHARDTTERPRFYACYVRGRPVVVDSYAVNDRSDFKRIKGFGTLEQARRSARTRQQRWEQRQAAKAMRAARRPSAAIVDAVDAVDAPDAFDALDFFPTITDEDQAQQRAYDAHQTLVADYEAYVLAQMEADANDDQEEDGGNYDA